MNIDKLIEGTVEILNKYVGMENYYAVGSFAAYALGVPGVIIKDLDVYADPKVFGEIWRNTELCSKIYVSRPEMEISEDGVFSGVCMRIRPAALLPINISHPLDLNGKEVPRPVLESKRIGEQWFYVPSTPSFIKLLETKGRAKDMRRIETLRALSRVE